MRPLPVAPVGYHFSPQDVGSDDTINGDGPWADIVLLPGESVTDVDAGLYRLASIGDFVWEDSNADGL